MQALVSDCLSSNSCFAFSKLSYLHQIIEPFCNSVYLSVKWTNIYLNQWCPKPFESGTFSASCWRWVSSYSSTRLSSIKSGLYSRNLVSIPWNTPGHGLPPSSLPLEGDSSSLQEVWLIFEQGGCILVLHDTYPR